MPIAVGATTARPSHGSGGLDGLLLDIGGDVGALIVYVDGRWLGHEIEVGPLDEPGAHRTHTVVRGHRSGIVAAVFVELAAGSYTLWHPVGGRTWGEVDIAGGAIAELDRRAEVS